MLRHSNYNRKKRYSCLAIIPCANSIAIVAPFQLRPEKNKDTVVCPLLRRSKYDRKKKQKSGGCAIVITTGKEKVLVVCLAGA
jgi:hypothetical protein